MKRFRISERLLNKAINESIGEVLGKSPAIGDGISQRKTMTAWNGIKRALENIQEAMRNLENETVVDPRYMHNERRRSITKKDVEAILDYIDLTINNVLSSSLPEFMR